jgi:hypothetical protein
VAITRRVRLSRVTEFPGAFRLFNDGIENIIQICISVRSGRQQATCGGVHGSSRAGAARGRIALPLLALRIAATGQPEGTKRLDAFKAATQAGFTCGGFA